MTSVREMILQTISFATDPLSAKDILEKLNKNNFQVNKTTIYRDLVFFKNKGLVKEVIFNDGVIRYESISDHHHHLVCNNCHKIEEVTNKRVEKLFGTLEDQLKKGKNFKSIKHSLEFFGLCINCQ